MIAMKKKLKGCFLLLFIGLCPMTLNAQESCPVCLSYQALVKELVTIMRDHDLNLSKAHRQYMAQLPTNTKQLTIDSLRTELERTNVFLVKYAECLLQEKPYLELSLAEIESDTLLAMQSRTEGMVAYDDRIGDFYNDIGRMVILKSGYDSVYHVINSKYDKSNIESATLRVKSLADICVADNHKKEIQRVQAGLDGYDMAVIAFRGMVKNVQGEREGMEDNPKIVEKRMKDLFGDKNTQAVENDYIFPIPYMRALYLIYKDGLLSSPLGNERTRAIETEVLDQYNKLD